MIEWFNLPAIVYTPWQHEHLRLIHQAEELRVKQRQFDYQRQMIGFMYGNLITRDRSYSALSNMAQYNARADISLANASQNVYGLAAWKAQLDAQRAEEERLALVRREKLKDIVGLDLIQMMEFTDNAAEQHGLYSNWQDSFKSLG